MYKLLITLSVLLMIALPVLAQDGGIPVQLEGTIEAVEANTITVEGFVLDISQLVLETPPEIDMVVAIKGILTDGDAIVVTELTVLETPPDDAAASATIEFAGVVDSYEDTTMIVSGLTIDVSQADVDDDIEAKDIVKLSASAEGIIEVKRIEIPDREGNDDEPAEFKLTAFVERSGEHHIVAGGVTIIAIDEGDIETDSLIKAEGIIVEDVLIASAIEIFEHADRTPEFDIRGIVQEIEDDTMIISGVEMSIEDVDTDVEPGNRVHVRGLIEDGEFRTSAVEQFGNPNQGRDN